MGFVGPLIVAIAFGSALVVLHARWRTAVRAEFIRGYTLPIGLYEKLRRRRPTLTLKDCQLVGHALRQFFLAHLKSGRQFVSMPSQVADELWHEFILYTKNYEVFCRRAFGRFLHHSPAAVLGSNRQSNVGLRRVWWYSCREENINPRQPTRLPLLFALDAKLDIADGFRYLPDCKGFHKIAAEKDSATVVYCGGDFVSLGVDGSIEGFGNAGCGGASHAGEHGGHGHGCSGHGSSGHGCGGSSCGGGCGGGD
jgi:hypothetical protein